MIIITMAGDGNRFKSEGFIQNKYELCLGSKTLLQRSLLSFKDYFNEETICIAYRTDLISKNWLVEELNAIGLITNVEYVGLSRITKGQAATAYFAVKEVGLALQERLIIFNIDSFYTSSISLTAFAKNQSTIDLVQRPGDHWSFAQINENYDVLQVAEKHRISNFCSTGLYHFQSTSLYIEAFETYKFDRKTEMYIMPLYNYLIQKNYKVKGRVINDGEYIIAGTPAEYREALKYYE